MNQFCNQSNYFRRYNGSVFVIFVSLITGFVPAGTVIAKDFSLKIAPIVVEQKDHKFSELFLKIKNSDILKFVNHDDVNHHLEFRHKGQRELMNAIEPGKFQEVTFSHSGIYDVQCKNHPEMRLTIFIPYVANLTRTDSIAPF